MPGENKTFAASKCDGSIFHVGFSRVCFPRVRSKRGSSGRAADGNQFVCANESKPGSHQG